MSAGEEIETAGQEPAMQEPKIPNLLLALGLASLAHILLLFALTANPDVRRGVEATVEQTPGWPGIRAQIMAERAPAVAAQISPVPLEDTASDVALSIEQKMPVQKKSRGAGAPGA